MRFTETLKWWLLAGVLCSLSCSKGAAQDDGQLVAGPCGEVICIAVYDPVCGVDGITYGNDCVAASCGVAIQCEQACPCPSETVGLGSSQADASCDPIAQLWNLSCSDSGGPSRRVQPAMGTSMATASAGQTRMGIFPAAATTSGLAMARTASAGAAPTIGLTTGGAQDVSNFRANIEEGYLPLPTDVSFTGIIKEYFFNMQSNSSQPCQALFCPSYSVAVSPDPLVDNGTQQMDVFVAVGLDSRIQADQFTRKKLNLVVVLDVSGSMGSPFTSYYYDPRTSNGERDQEVESKMSVARQSLIAMLEQLNADDRFGLVIFSTSACSVKQLGRWGCVNEQEFYKHIKEELTEGGSTNMAAGMDLGTDMLQGCEPCMNAGQDEYENRIIFITDAQINTGDISSEGILQRVTQNARNNIFTTVIGVGVDFNTELIDTVTKTRGANYFSVHSPEEFKTKLGEEFEYMVTPLVFDLQLAVDPSSLEGSQGWKILAAYGSPKEEGGLSATGEVMRVDTLFPAPKTEEGVRGGVILLRMKPGSSALGLVVKYEDRNGSLHSSNTTVDAAQVQEAVQDKKEFYQSSGVRKAVVVARYTDMLQGWLLDEWQEIDESQPGHVIPRDYCRNLPLMCSAQQQQLGITQTGSGCRISRWLSPHRCILPPPPPVINATLGRWERQSEPLQVSQEHKEAFSDFIPHMGSAINEVDDDELQQEVRLLQKLTST